MEFLAKALESLPAIATSPYALIGYLVTVAAWSWAMHRSVRLRVLMAKLHELPEDERIKVVQLELGEVLPAHISAEQWLRARNHRHFMVAGIALLVTLTTIAVVSINAGVELAKAAEQSRVREAEAASRQAALTSQRRGLERRMQDLDKKIIAAEMELRRGAMGLQLAPEDQRQIAMDIMRAAAAEKTKLQAEKANLQVQIDALPLL